MTYREEFLTAHPSVHPGMKAFSEDGEELGKISDLDEDSVVVKKGIFFPKDFTIRYDDIVDIQDDSVRISRTGSDVEAWKDEKYPGWSEYDRMEAEPGEEQRIPLREEQVDVTKKKSPAGNVHLRKVVHTEMKTMEVPVQKEDVILERRPVSEPQEAADTAAEFKEEEITIPVTEEEVDVTKRPVIKEEVIARKEKREAKQKIDASVRKEDVTVERNDELRKEDQKIVDEKKRKLP